MDEDRNGDGVPDIDQDHDNDGIPDYLDKDFRDKVDFEISALIP